MGSSGPGNSGCKLSGITYSEMYVSKWRFDLKDVETYTVNACPIYIASSTVVPRWMVDTYPPLSFWMVKIERKVKRFWATRLIIQPFTSFLDKWVLLLRCGAQQTIQECKRFQDSVFGSLATVTAVSTVASSPRLGGHDDVYYGPARPIHTITSLLVSDGPLAHT
nr:hypothetical protein [Tanacetum cinerariifolium]